ncbi:MAG: T9SS type A sorting domain-containing protein [Flavobacteriales bacterium]|nr:T9SS type A sorting domain-containing protein [Flavobacteriales bacterium]
MCRSFMMMVVVLLAARSTQAQTPNIICDVTEFCYCYDGPLQPGEPIPGMSFIICPDSMNTSSISVVFCSGGTPTGFVIRSFSSMDDTGPPITGSTGSFQDIHGVTGVSENASLYIEFDPPELALSCTAGDFLPIRFLVFPTPWELDPWPETTECIGSGPTCLTTGIPALVEITTLTAGADGRIMLPASLSASAQLELFDAQGRSVKEFRSSPSAQWIDLGQRNAGIYVLRLFDGRTSRTFRVVVPEGGRP